MISSSVAIDGEATLSCRNEARRPSEPLAIIGIGCRFPGGSNSPAAFWNALAAGSDAITDIPSDRWNIDAFYHPELGRAGKTNARWGGFLEGIDQFDAAFFGISPREASRMDPQQRLLLEVAFEALEDGGQPLERWSGKDVAVFVGLSNYDYGIMQVDFRDRTSIDGYSNMGIALSIAANRLAYCFNFKGPNAVVDTACSSGLVAVHMACQSLWRGECRLALAGAANALLSPDGFIGFSKMSVLAADGRCKAFDARADGFVRGEGAGVVVLKPLSLALAEGDRVYAVLLSTAVNQDGRTPTMSAPSEQSQAALLWQAACEAGLDPAEIQYVETHGTGTAVGDPIEARALGKVLAGKRPDDRPCLIGSVKTNIGHLEPASGIAGLIKTALAVYHRQVPASLHFQTPNPEIPFQALRLRVPQQLEPWPLSPGPATAGVNSFGFGGTNAHAILQEAPPPQFGSGPDAAVYLVPLSARSPEALQQLAASCKDLLADGEPSLPSLRDLAFTAGVRRSHHEHRLAVVARSTADLTGQLGILLAGAPSSSPAAEEMPRSCADRVAFVFSGQGPQWWGMGRQLLAQEPVFREVIKRCDGILDGVVGWSLLDELTAEESRSRLEETAIAQPALFALQAALVELWGSWGIRPAAVIGHSVGEVAAAWTAGALSLEDAVRVIGQRGRCMELASARGGMLAVGLSLQEVAPLLESSGGTISVAAINGPASVTLSGPVEDLQRAAHWLEQRDIFHRLLRVNYAFHSPALEPVRGELLRSLENIRPRPATLPMVSTVTSERVEGPDLGAEYWWRNLREPVRFADGVGRLIEDGYQLVVEVGPHPVLTGPIHECYRRAGQKVCVLPSLRRQEEERATLLQSLGTLYTLGASVAWEKVNPGGCFVPLPSYPWQHQRFWHEAEASRLARTGRPDHPLLGLPLPAPLPSWEAELDTRRLSWLGDHRVLGEVVFPATAYLEMAQAAARMAHPGDSYSLEEVRLLRACVLPAGQPVLLQTILQTDEGTFQVAGRRPGSEGSWTMHARGLVRPRVKGRSLSTVDLDEIRQRCPRAVYRDECYRQLSMLGLDYGPAFQGISHLWCGDRECLARLEAPRPSNGKEGSNPLPPATVDAGLQAILWTVAGSAGQAANGTTTAFVPVEVAEVRVHEWSGQPLWAHARLLEKTRDHILADVDIVEESGCPVWEARGLRCQALPGQGKDDGAALDELVYEFRWHLAPLNNAPRVASAPATDLPDLERLAPQIQADAQQLLTEQDVGGHQQRFQEEADRLCASYVWSALQECGADFQPGQRFSLEALAVRLHVVSRHRRALQSYLGWLVEEDVLRQQGDEWEVLRRWTAEPPVEGWRGLLHRHPAFSADLLLLEPCGRQLAQVLRGEVDPLQLLFPNGALTITEQFYQDGFTWRFNNLVAQNALRRLVEKLPKGRPLRILEIGAGTGGLSAYLLPCLPPERTDYVFTDLSGHFLDKAGQKLRDYPFVRYQRLDIEQEPAAQGFEAHSFDVIVASQVLHATAELRQTLAHVRGLLASGGWLLLAEWVRSARLLDLVFGLLEGWWRFQDFDLRPDHPWLDWPGWQGLLERTGFRDVVDLTGCQEPIGSALIAARGPAVERPAREAVRPSACTEAAGSWLLFADRGGFGASIARLLEARGERCTLVAAEDFAAQGECPKLAQILTEWTAHGSCRGIVYLGGFDAPSVDDMTTQQLDDFQRAAGLRVVHLAQACASAPGGKSRLVLVTRRAQSVDGFPTDASPAQAMLWGLGRVINNETPELRCQLIDLGGDDVEAEARALCAELAANSPEDEIALRGQARYVHRYEHADSHLPRSWSGGDVLGPGEGFRLEASSAATLDRLTLRALRRQRPAPGEVEIEVLAAGLNFSDVLKGLGLYPGLPEGPVPLGLECTGKVCATGEGVEDFQVGDEVLALANFSISKYVCVPAGLLVRKPRYLSFQEAATLPVAFLTAHHALHHLGRMETGERVLIHSATGGVGLAAVQLARTAGAEVFATAGTAEKRDFLHALGIAHVMDSRSLDFADEVMRRTSGRGVDLILNSLSGPAIPAGLRILADHGRFLEIGKRDIYANSKLSMLAFRNNASLFAIDLDRGLRARPTLFAAHLRHLIERVEKGELAPLPYRVFPLNNVRAAFRHMAQSKHIGKIVLSLQGARPAVAPTSERRPLVTPQGSYLITGGLGGFGLAVARWLAEQGARSLILLGRSGAATPQAQEAVRALQEAGVQVLVARGDVAKAEDIDRILEETERSLPPLRGVIHAAMVLDDCSLGNLTPERWQRVVGPKALGAWNLHQRTRQLSLDFFVCFSSMSTVFGMPGQASYCAANAFLDALAHHRQSLGLPGLSVNWGYLGEVGYVAQNEKLGQRFESWGVSSFSPRQGLALLGQLLHQQAAQAGIVRVDWGRWRPPGVSDTLPPHFQALCTAGARPPGEVAEDRIPLRPQLLKLDLPERRKLLQTALQDRVARVLGSAAAQLDVNKSLNDLGLDSLVGTELRSWITAELQVTLPALTLVQGPSVVQLTEMLLEQLARELPAGGQASEANGQQARSAPRAGAEAPGGDGPARPRDPLAADEVDELLLSMLADKQ